MDWKAQLGKLWNVQLLDRRADALGAERQSLLDDSEGMARQRALHTDEERLAVLVAEMEGVTRRQRLLELEHKSQVAERDKLNQRLYGGEVRNPRDLAGLGKNIEGVARRISDLETGILEAMEALETFTDKRTLLQHRIATHRQQLEQHRNEARKRLGEVDKELPTILAQREDAARQVDIAALREYERLRRKPGGIAIARVTAAVCGACGVELSTLVRARLRHPEELVSCEHCGRLLWEE